MLLWVNVSLYHKQTNTVCLNGLWMRDETKFKLDSGLKKVQEDLQNMETDTQSSPLSQGPKVEFEKRTQFFQDTELCVFKRRKKKHLRYFLVELFLLWLNFDPLGHTYGVFPLIRMWWLFHVHEAMKHLSHMGAKNENVFPLIRCEVHPSIDLTDCQTDWQTDCLLFVSVLFCSILKEIEWFVNVCVL